MTTQTVLRKQRLDLFGEQLGFSICIAGIQRRSDAQHYYHDPNPRLGHHQESSLLCRHVRQNVGCGHRLSLQHIAIELVGTEIDVVGPTERAGF